jgi:serine/threonine protein kinase
VVHQDIKPQNILLDDSGRPRLIDFGMARWRHAWSDSQAGPSGGTLAFMAPEQARCESERIGAASDIFALGGVLYFLLTGQVPFGGETRDESWRRAINCDFDRSALRAKGIPHRLERIVLKAMAAQPEERYASAAEMAGALDAFCQRPRRLALPAGILLLGALAFGIWSLGSRPAREAEPTPRIDPGDAVGRSARHVPKAPAAGHADDTVISPVSLTANRDRQGKYAEAESLLRKALAIRIKTMGEGHPSTAESYTNLAFNLDAQGKHAEAEPLLRKALDISLKALGEGHPQTATSYNNLAFNLYAQARQAEAEDLYRRARDIRPRVPGQDHPDTLQKSPADLAVNLSDVPPSGKPAPQSLRIESFQFALYRRGPEDPKGLVGIDAFAARFSQDVRGQVRLSMPAHCFLIALNPDGLTQLCYPESPTTAPAATTTIDYPSDPASGFGLTDGVGTQAFVLVASGKPLPPYAEWSRKLGNLPWKPVATEDVWRYDGHSFDRDTQRGAVRPLSDLPPPLEAACRALKAGPGVDAIQALTFPVRPQQEAKKEPQRPG